MNTHAVAEESVSDGWAPERLPAPPGGVTAPPAWVLVRRGLAARVPDPQRPCLVRIRLVERRQRHGEEAGEGGAGGLHFKLEDWLVQHLPALLNACYVARLGPDPAWEFCFYVPRPEEVAACMDRLHAAFPEYKVEAQTLMDAGWSVFRGWLGVRSAPKVSAVPRRGGIGSRWLDAVRRRVAGWLGLPYPGEGSSASSSVILQRQLLEVRVAENGFDDVRRAQALAQALAEICRRGGHLFDGVDVDDGAVMLRLMCARSGEMVNTVRLLASRHELSAAVRISVRPISGGDWRISWRGPLQR